MSFGYNVVLPNGRVQKQRAADEEKRVALVNDLLDKWAGYCEENWISPTKADPYSPENRVKVFLNGLSYFLMVGDTVGIVTNYKDIVNGKREIPISSCPAYVSDLLYGGGSTIQPPSGEDDTGFQTMLERLDEKAKRVERKKSEKKSAPLTRRGKLRRLRDELGECEFFFATVDTDNVFSYRDEKYRIADSVVQYRPKGTEYGLLYDMDHVICVKCGERVLFFDMNVDQIPDECVEKIFLAT